MTQLPEASVNVSERRKRARCSGKDWGEESEGENMRISRVVIFFFLFFLEEMNM